MTLLLDDQSLFGGADVPTAVAAHQRHRQAPYGPLVGLLAVADRRLAEIGRLAGDVPIGVTVVSSTGAGGLPAATRTAPGLQVRAVETALRDLDDLAGNATRVARAAAELDESITVFVEVPVGRGARDALEVVEAAGLSALVRVGEGDPVGLVTHLSDLVEADLAFKAVVPDAFAWPLLLTVAALVDGAEPDEAAELLHSPAGPAALSTWDAPTWTRVARRVRRLGVGDVEPVAAELVARGLRASA